MPENQNNKGEKMNTTLNKPMRKIGIIGGMSTKSTIEYYRIINDVVQQKLGGLNSARIGLESVNMAEIAKLQEQGDWDSLTDIIQRAAWGLEDGGADFIVIATNTMHKVADNVQANIRTPLLHIADTLAEEIKKKGLKKVGLIGTQITMKEDFYKKRLAEKHGIEVIIPETPDDLRYVDRIIFEELCKGYIIDQSRNAIGWIMSDLIDNGAEGIALGCTELPLLISQKDAKVPIFDTTLIHATAAAECELRIRKA